MNTSTNNTRNNTVINRTATNNTASNGAVTGRRIMMALTAVALVVALILGISSLGSITAATANLPQSNKVALDNVRAYAAAPDSATGVNYAIDGGLLYAGKPLDWMRVALPDGVIANAVIADTNNSNNVYVGAANELAVYRSTDGGMTWLKATLPGEYIGAVTSLAYDAHNKILFAGTDTAGIFRLMDVGSSLIDGGHTEVSEPVLQVATDSTGAAFAFFRTPSSIYALKMAAWAGRRSTRSSVRPRRWRSPTACRPLPTSARLTWALPRAPMARPGCSPMTV